jgi:NAD+ kinase
MDHDDTANITLDGQNVVSIKSRDNIKINKETRKSVLVIKNDEKSYFHTLKEKFVHGRREV